MEIRYKEQKIVTWQAQYNDVNPESFADYLRLEAISGWDVHLIEPTVYSNNAGPDRLVNAVIIFRKYE
jgi:hypothetical protein